ncbi:MAG TPA: DEAD/DEAH box helicase [Burkholderiales bacterium]|nr:DEAD/DEAH box helicase [Burkholderiales bacterium]
MSDAFASLGLAAELVRAVAEEGYSVPTPIQVEAIPHILAGRDVLAGAQTGTGKTAGFTLPLLQRLAASDAGHRGIRALILTPTRELAAQVEESVRVYGRHLALRTALVYGGVGFAPQAEALEAGPEILVATPGRLLDHVAQQTVDLQHVEILVLDEADRMLDMGFIQDIRKVLALLPPKRQNLLFSATFSDEIRDLANGLLHNPAHVQVAPRNAESALVAQRIHPVDQGRKRALLAHLISSGDWRQVLVFTRTKHGANRLAEQLGKDGIEAAAIHGNKSQGARTRALAAFKSGELRVLVATDLAARGLDIEELPHVVNYELPNVPEHYVHRIGRTGRAGVTGEAISLVSPDEHSYLADIEKLLKRNLERTVVPGFEPGTAAQPARAAADRPVQRPQEHRRPQRPQPRRDHRPPAPEHARRPPAPEQARRPPPTEHAARAGADDEERQPSTNANAQFPSSGPVTAPGPARKGGRDARRTGRERGREVPALLRGTGRRNG